MGPSKLKKKCGGLPLPWYLVAGAALAMLFVLILHEGWLPGIRLASADTFGILVLLLVMLLFAGGLAELVRHLRKDEDKEKVVDTWVLVISFVAAALVAVFTFLGAEPPKNVASEVAWSATAGILIALFVFVSSVVYAFDQKIKDRMQQATIASENLKRVVDETREAVMSLVGIKSRKLGDLRNECQGPFEQYAIALARWAEYEGQSSTLPQIFSSYLLEEAFDFLRHEVATKPRNYTMFLLRATDQLARFAQTQQKTLHVCTVTPVAPHYMFNWPQMSQQNGSWYPAALDFLSQYYLFQQQWLDNSHGSQVRFHRWNVLVQESQDVLPYASEKPNLLLVPCPARWNELRTLLGVQFPTFENEFRQLVPGGTGAAPADDSIVWPVFTAGSRSSAATVAANIATLREYRNTEARDALVTATSGQAAEHVARVQRALDGGSLSDANGDTVVRLHDSMQHLALEVQRVSNDPNSSAANELLQRLTYCLAAAAWKPNWHGDPLPLLDAYSSRYHSPTLGGAFCHTMVRKPALNDLATRKNPEFVLFGLGDDGSRPQELQDWPLGVTATLTHPWKASHIKLHVGTGATTELAAALKAVAGSTS